MIELMDRKGEINIFHHEDVIKVFQEKSGSVKVCLLGGCFVRTNVPLKEVLADCGNLCEITNSDKNIEYANPKFVTLIQTTESGGVRVVYVDSQYTFTYEDIDSIRERFDQDN
jgi:hypothetical protein